MKVFLVLIALVMQPLSARELTGFYTVFGMQHSKFESDAEYRTAKIYDFKLGYKKTYHLCNWSLPFCWLSPTKLEFKRTWDYNAMFTENRVRLEWGLEF